MRIHGFKTNQDYNQLYTLPLTEGYTLLHKAALYVDWGKCAELLRQGHNPFRFNSHGHSPLHFVQNNVRMRCEGRFLLRDVFVKALYKWRQVLRLQRWWKLQLKYLIIFKKWAKIKLGEKQSRTRSGSCSRIPLEVEKSICSYSKVDRTVLKFRGTFAPPEQTFVRPSGAEGRLWGDFLPMPWFGVWKELPRGRRLPLRGRGSFAPLGLRNLPSRRIRRSRRTQKPRIRASRRLRPSGPVLRRGKRGNCEKRRLRW